MIAAQVEFAVRPHIGCAGEIDFSRQLRLHGTSGGRCAPAAEALRALGLTNVTPPDVVFENREKAGDPRARPARSFCPSNAAAGGCRRHPPAFA